MQASAMSGGWLACWSRSWHGRNHHNFNEHPGSPKVSRKACPRQAISVTVHLLHRAGARGSLPLATPIKCTVTVIRRSLLVEFNGKNRMVSPGPFLPDSLQNRMRSSK